jgi:hypothetical protein
MSLICVMCNRVVILSDNPDHLCVCSRCPIDELTEAQKIEIEKSA